MVSASIPSTADLQQRTRLDARTHREVRRLSARVQGQPQPEGRVVLGDVAAPCLHVGEPRGRGACCREVKGPLLHLLRVGAKGKRRVGDLGRRALERCRSGVLLSGPEGRLEQASGLLERRVAVRGHFDHAAFTSTITTVQLGSSAASGSANGPEPPAKSTMRNGSAPAVPPVASAVPSMVMLSTASVARTSASAARLSICCALRSERRAVRWACRSLMRESRFSRCASQFG